MMKGDGMDEEQTEGEEPQLEPEVREQSVSNLQSGLWRDFPDRQGRTRGDSLKDCPQNSTGCQGAHFPPE